MATNWLEDLKILLDRICRFMNGASCNFTDSTTASERIASIYALYKSDGCLGLSTDDAQDDLGALKGHLALPANSLSSDDNDKLNTIITSCWNG